MILNHAVIAFLMQFMHLLMMKLFYLEMISLIFLLILQTIVFVSELGFHLLHIPEWCEGQVTEYLVATFSDYFTDVKM